MKDRLTNTTRKAVYKRDGYQCAICGSTRTLQIHHYIPRGKGGTDSMHNLITLCDCCHAMAHDINLLGYEDLTQEGIEQLILEYLADTYAGHWKPWGPGMP